jgi:hypothetical protein
VGVVQPPSDRPAGGDCFGETLKELRAAGRVMEFKPNTAEVIGDDLRQ